MSVAAYVDDLSEEVRRDIWRELKIYDAAKKENVSLFRIASSRDGDVIYIPFAYGLHRSLAILPNFDAGNSMLFAKELRANQIEELANVLSSLHTDHRCLLSLHVGWGKTVFSLYLASTLGLQTTILVHRKVLLKQWAEAITTFLPQCTFTIISAAKKAQDADSWQNCNFVISMMSMVSKSAKAFRKFSQTLICDELHALCAPNLINSLRHLTPLYLIGLSATPYRFDTWDAAIALYFGIPTITTELMAPGYSIIVHETRCWYTIARDSESFWNEMLTQQANSVQRNQLIVDSVNSFFAAKKYEEGDCVLLMCKRIEQARHLHSALSASNSNCELYIGETSSYSASTRILCTTVSKCGIGFSDNRFTVLVLAGDVESYFIQVLGRVFRSPKSKPLIIDFVDPHPVFRRHFETRRLVYEKTGGIIKTPF